MWIFLCSHIAQPYAVMLFFAVFLPSDLLRFLAVGNFLRFPIGQIRGEPKERAVLCSSFFVFLQFSFGFVAVLHLKPPNKQVSGRFDSLLSDGRVVVDPALTAAPPGWFMSYRFISSSRTRTEGAEDCTG